MKADIQPGGLRFDCDPGQTLLQAADAAGIEPVRTVTTAVIPRGKLKNK